MGKKKYRSSKSKKTSNLSKPLVWIGGSIITIIIIVVVALKLSNGNDHIILPHENDRSIISKNTTGNPEAPVKVEVFSNFQCGHCKIFATEVEPEIIKKYVNTGKVYMIHNTISWQGSKAAQAAYCAMDQDKFWQYHDILFANQTNEAINGIADENLIPFAKKIGLNVEDFSKCLEDDKHAEIINEIQNSGYERGITGTPMFIVNNELVKSYRYVEAAIEKNL